MAVFNGVDFVRIDDLFTDEEKTIRQAVRDWVEEQYLPIVEHHYEAATFPMETIPQIRLPTARPVLCDGVGAP